MAGHVGGVAEDELPGRFEGGQIGGSIDDAQARFNVNNLAVDGIVSRVELLRLRRLLEILELPQALADALADWIDADGNLFSAAKFSVTVAYP